MLSFSHGTPVARISGGKLDGNVIYVDENSTDYSQSSDRMKKKFKPDPFESLGVDFFEKKTGRKLKPYERDAIASELSKYEDYDSDDEKGGYMTPDEDEMSDDPYKEGLKLKPLRKKKKPAKKYPLDKVTKMAKKKMNAMLGKEIIINDGHIVPIDTGKHRNILACGPSGSGKSTALFNDAKEWKRHNRDGKIIIFSRLEKDEVLDKLNPTRIKIDEELLENPIKFEELEDCFVIFDDTDTIQDKNLAKYISKLRDDLAQCGRHHNILCATTSHHILNYRASRDMLMEATCIYVYPRSGGSSEIESFCKKYMSMKKDQIEKILNLPSRWVMISKTFPYYVIYDSGVYIL